MQQRNDCLQTCGAGVAALYDRYAASIFAYARLRAPSLEDAEDVMLEVFTAALEQEKLATLTEHQQFVWLRQVAHHKLVDRYRRVAHLPVVPLEQVIEAVREEEVLSPEHIVLRREELERLCGAVARLPLVQQQLLQLRFGEGLRFAEIAVLLNKREPAVRKLCSRALASLRVAYQSSEKGAI